MHKDIKETLEDRRRKEEISFQDAHQVLGVSLNDEVMWKSKEMPKKSKNSKM